MASNQSDTELTAAIDSMFRIRAVESPPDEKGERTIWHRGARGAELVSWVDASGTVTRQELTVFENVVLWTRGRPVKTGLVKANTGSKAHQATSETDFEPEPNRGRVELLNRALKPYKGTDRFITHVRDQIRAWLGSFEMEPEAVTRPSSRVALELGKTRNAARPPPEKRNTGLIVAGVGLLLVVIAVAMLLLK